MALGGGAGEELGVGVGNSVCVRSAESAERRPWFVRIGGNATHSFIHSRRKKIQTQYLRKPVHETTSRKWEGAEKKIQQSNGMDAGSCGVGDA